MFPIIAHRVSDYVRWQLPQNLRPRTARRLSREALIAATRAELFAEQALLAVTGTGPYSRDAGATRYTDPVVARIQERRRRIEQSGLTLIKGGGS